MEEDLSFKGRRLTLIKSMFSSLPIFLMPLLKIRTCIVIDWRNFKEIFVKRGGGGVDMEVAGKFH